MQSPDRSQITVQVRNEAGEPFVSFESQRVTNGVTDPATDNFDQMPMSDTPRDHFVQGFGGDTDVSGGVNNTSLANGFARKAIDPHNDIPPELFNGEVTEGGKTGFCMRNNYLDRN